MGFARKIWTSTKRMLTFRREPTDARSRRVVFLIECLVNQNARDLGAARSPAAVRPLVEMLLEREVGLVQIPCPEIACLGFARQRAPGQRIRDALSASGPLACCSEQAVATAERIQCYLEQGYRVVAVLGGNAESPGCAVHLSGTESCTLSDRSGLFMQALAAELARRRLRVPFRGMRDNDATQLQADLTWLRERL